MPLINIVTKKYVGHFTYFNIGHNINKYAFKNGLNR